MKNFRSFVPNKILRRIGMLIKLFNNKIENNGFLNIKMIINVLSELFPFNFQVIMM